jgi:hypothetical protein
MNHAKSSRELRAISLGAMALGIALATPPAEARRWEFDNGTVLNVDTVLSYGAQTRLQERYSGLIGRDNGGTAPITGDIGQKLHGPGGEFASNPDFNFLNGDNGNLNFDDGSITSATIKGTHEIGLRWGDGWEGLARFSWLYDHAVDDGQYTELSAKARRIAELNLTPLDFWISKDFEVGGQPVKVRLGNQVVSWGEDVFILGGINTINALDIRRFRTPGTQIKEVLRPAPMFYFNAGVTDSVSIEGYYQFLWNDFRFDPVGTFLSGADIAGRGQLDAFAPSSFGLCGNFDAFTCGDGILTPAIPGANIVPQYRSDRDPEKSGQFGVALRYIPESFDAEFGLYYVHFHDKLPFTSFVFDPSIQVAGNPLGLGYFNEFGEDKHLIGISGNTKIGPIAVGSELSYRPKESVAIDPTVPLSAGLAPFGLAAGSTAMGHSIMDVVGCALGTGDVVTPGPGKQFDAACTTGYTRGYVEEEKWQAHLTGFYFIEIDSVFGDMMRALGAAEGYVLAEMAVTHFPSLDPRNVPYLVFPSYDVPDKTSAGYVVELSLTYPNVLGSFTVTPVLDFYHDFSGTTPNALPFVEDRKSVFLGVTADYNNFYKFQVGYTSYFGGGSSNIMRDRDFLGLSASIGF